ncbi:hypothetical protein ACMGDH_11595 [Sphingomonas sp. DT-207]|uniref:hypothetical protein n=1 Tax=Sphingomonas sp. DT-207 TaxID=3396167 RepID=UPI003F1CAC29
MSGRKNQGILLLLFSLALSIFLTTHSLVVSVDFDACFENLAASVNGSRPYLQVGEMPFGELARKTVQQFSADALFIALLGLIPLSPFMIAWLVSKNERDRTFWIASAFVALVAIVAWVSTTSLAAFYDCELSGVGLGLLIAPILYAAISLVAVIGLAVLRFLALLFGGRA